MAIIRGESCFVKNTFEDTEKPHPPTKTRLPVKEYLGKYSRYRKKICFILKFFLRPVLFHGKLSFDNLTRFKLYGNLNNNNNNNDDDDNNNYNNTKSNNNNNNNNNSNNTYIAQIHDMINCTLFH